VGKTFDAERCFACLDCVEGVLDLDELSAGAEGGEREVGATHGDTG
jgi:hypothetical protein